MCSTDSWGQNVNWMKTMMSELKLERKESDYCHFHQYLWGHVLFNVIYSAQMSLKKKKIEISFVLNILEECEEEAIKQLAVKV